MKKINLFALTIVAMLFSFATFAQNTVTGVVVDGKTSESLPGASVTVKGTTAGTITNFEGKFSFTTKVSGKQTLLVSFIGYAPTEVEVNINGTLDAGTVKLLADEIGLDEVNIIASVAIDRKTPVAVSKIDPMMIEEKLGTQEFPEILKSTPSVYATRQGGGYGDARINMRGFDSRNIAVMVNGVPVNDMENGWVYWSNWAGLADVTRSMQVQRGLGASKVAVPSIGGTINILTKTTDIKKGGNVFYTIGNDGYEKKGFMLSTGLTEKGWAATASASMTTGNGYVDGTEFEAYAYYVNLSKQINDKHRVSLSVVGAPQWHGQRSSSMSIEKMYSEGIKYNPDWGYKNGEVTYLRKNFYHKPQAIFNHFWSITDKTSLSTALYASMGVGGGTGGYGADGGKFYTYMREGQIDFDRIVDENVARGDLGSSAILRASNNEHQWYGMLTNLRHEFDMGLTLSGGLDLRYYKGEHYRDVLDLLGGDFYIDNKDANDPQKVVREGDIIAYHNDGLVGWAGTFAQVEYTTGNLSVFAAGSFSNVSNKRIDYFQYTVAEGQETDWASYFAFSGKGGANYNLTDNHNVFMNAGYFERQPDFKAVYLNNANDLNPDAQNEKILSFELGYGFRSHYLNANVNLYNTEWQDKTFVRGYQQPDGTYYTANLLGVDAVHRGVEFDFEMKPLPNLSITGMLSVGDWRWKNDLVDQKVYDEDQVEVGTVDLYIADVPVGDAAQTTAAFGINYTFLKSIKIGVDYNYFDRLYAKFDPIGGGYNAPLTDGGNVNPWTAPTYNLVDLNIKYSFELGGFDAALYGKVMNLLDVEYISDAFDGGDHDWSSAKTYYGLGRTWSLSLKLKF